MTPRAQRWLGVIALLAAAVGGAGYLRWRARPVAVTPTLAAPQTPVVAAAPPIPFRDVTAAAGIGFVRENGARGERLLPETMGGGAAFLDYDVDGRPDLLLVNGEPWPEDGRRLAPRPHLTLYRNLGGGRFVDVSAASGLAVELQGMGVAVGDVDNDGWVDVFVTTVGRCRLFHNDRGHFRDVTSAAGVGGDDASWHSAAAFFDLEGDGDLDLVVGRYVAWSRALDLAGGFTLTGIGRAYGPPTSFTGADPILYTNDGQGRFKDSTARSGVAVHNAATDVPVAKTLAIQPLDVDGDGRLDLVVANDTTAKFLLRNLGDGTFEEQGIASGLAFDRYGNATGAMGVDAGYVFPERAAAAGATAATSALAIFVANFANEMTSAYVAQREAGVWADEAIGLGLGGPTRTVLKFGILLLDADLDGRLDLVQTNGHLEAEIARVDPSQSYQQPGQLFWNNGAPSGPTFVLAADVGDLARPLVGRGSATADIDGDGDLDLVVMQPAGPAVLLRNDQASGHHWLRFSLQGAPSRGSNRDAIGARIELAAGGQTQRRVVMPTRSYLSQSELVVTFGLGANRRADTVRIIWPGGGKQELLGVAADQTLRVVEPP